MKRITLISGANDDSYLDVERALGRLCGAEPYLLREMNIKYCVGCWDCWVKTPGICRHQDDMPPILASMVNSDLCLWVSPISMGFVTATTKRATDRIIPLVHPHIGVFEGEFHHLKRYKRYPKLGVVLLGDPENDRQSHGIITQVYRRLAINSKGEFAFSILTGDDLKEVEHALNSI